MARKITIKIIIESIDEIINTRPAMPEYSAILLAYAVPERKGLSIIDTTSKIIAELGEKGFPIEDFKDGTKNMMNMFVETVVTNIFDAIRHDARLEIGAQIGSMTLTGEGANAGGSVEIVGRNITANKSYGIIV